MKKFKTEVNQLLHLLVHSLYSNSEIFLRELVSNASDALGKLKYLTLTDDNFKNLEFFPRIDVRIGGSKQKTIMIEDNGIGMNKEDLTDSLGTIARSGTRKFMEALTGDSARDSSLIGRFGVGFYSCFMVAEKVEVISRKVGEQEAWKWSSDGKSGFDIDGSGRESQGTTVILYLNDAGLEYNSRWRVRSTIKKYSDNIAFPIHMHWTEVEDEGSKSEINRNKESKTGGEQTSGGTSPGEKTVDKSEQVNTASALWKRAKSDLKKKDYNEFYKTISHDTEDPMMCLHTHAEGNLEFTTLFYVPARAPEDMMNVNYQPGVKLYVKRVFITDDEKELLPTYLRFVRGIIDSEDLPLNVSREILQQNRIMVKIREASIRKILDEFGKYAENEEKYAKFIEQYNRPLKEGLYSDWEHKEDLTRLVRYKSTSVEGWSSLQAYVDRMPEDQKAIYYIAGENERNLRQSPLLAGFRDKGYEVLIMDDEVDEIVTPMIGRFQEKELKAVNRSGTIEDLQTDEDKKTASDAEPILRKIKKVLGDSVKDVIASTRLVDVPSCIVADDADPSVQMRQILKSMGQKDIPEATFILEVNPEHTILKSLKESSDEEIFTDVSHLLLEQALLVEGAELKDLTGFAARLNRVMAKAF